MISVIARQQTGAKPLPETDDIILTTRDLHTVLGNPTSYWSGLCKDGDLRGHRTGPVRNGDRGGHWQVYLEDAVAFIWRHMYPVDQRPALEFRLRRHAAGQKTSPPNHAKDFDHCEERA